MGIQNRLLMLFSILSLLWNFSAFANGQTKEHYNPKHRQPHKTEPSIPPAPKVTLPMDPDRFFNNGFYVGGQIGYSYMHGKLKNQLFLFATTDPFPDSAIDAKGDSSNRFIGEVLLGHRWYLPGSSDILMGIEIAGNWDGHRLKADFSDITLLAVTPVDHHLRVKKRFSLIPTLTLSHIICPRLIVFMKLGPALTRFRIDFSGLSPIADVGKSKTVVGVAPSLGFEYAYTKHLSWVGVFSYEAYPAINKRFNNLEAREDSFAFTKLKRPYVLAVKVGFLLRL